MDLELILFIASGVLTVLAGIFGVKYTNIKKLGKETVDVLVTALAALEDDKITAEETEAIVKEAKEAGEAFKAVFKKQ